MKKDTTGSYIGVGYDTFGDDAEPSAPIIDECSSLIQVSDGSCASNKLKLGDDGHDGHDGHDWQYDIGDYIDEIVIDLEYNLFIVSLPGCFTNTIWRLMNLYGISSSSNSGNEDATMWYTIWSTAVEIGPIVFILCFIVDYIRRYFYVTQRLNIGILISPSIILGTKFYFGVLFWTIGYQCGILVVNEYDLENDNTIKIIIHALFAAIGNYIGLLLICELINVYQYVVFEYDIFDAIEHYSSLGVAFRGFWEGLVWSILADLSLYKLYNTTGKIFDALTVGILASLAFSISGVMTSIFSLWYLSKSEKPYHPSTDAVPMIRDLTDTGPLQDTHEQLHFDHTLNRIILGESVFGSDGTASSHNSSHS